MRALPGCIICTLIYNMVNPTNERKVKGPMTVYVLHENPDWYPPFERAFIEAGVDAREWLLIEGEIDLDGQPPDRGQDRGHPLGP